MLCVPRFNFSGHAGGAGGCEVVRLKMQHADFQIFVYFTLQNNSVFFAPAAAILVHFYCPIRALRGQLSRDCNLLLVDHWSDTTDSYRRRRFFLTFHVCFLFFQPKTTISKGFWCTESVWSCSMHLMILLFWMIIIIQDHALALAIELIAIVYILVTH